MLFCSDVKKTMLLSSFQYEKILGWSSKSPETCKRVTYIVPDRSPISCKWQQQPQTWPLVQDWSIHRATTPAHPKKNKMYFGEINYGLLCIGSELRHGPFTRDCRLLVSVCTTICFVDSKWMICLIASELGIFRGQCKDYKALRGLSDPVRCCVRGNMMRYFRLTMFSLPKTTYRWWGKLASQHDLKNTILELNLFLFFCMYALITIYVFVSLNLSSSVLPCD